MIETSTFQIWAILAGVTAGFSLINMILVLIWLEQLELSQVLSRTLALLANADSFFDSFKDVYVLTAIIFTATFISGTISAITIFIKSDAPYISTLVDVAKVTILVGIIIQLQTAVSIGTSTGTATAVLAMSIIYLIVEIAGLVALCYLSIKSETVISNV